MSLRKKLITTSVLIMATIMVSVMGVISATSLSFSIQNSIGFVANSIAAEINITGINLASDVEFYDENFVIDYNYESINRMFNLPSAEFAGSGEENAILYIIEIKNIGSQNISLEIDDLVQTNSGVVLEQTRIIDGIESLSENQDVIYENEIYTINLLYTLQGGATEETYNSDFSCTLNPTEDERVLPPIVQNGYIVEDYQTEYLSYESVDTNDFILKDQATGNVIPENEISVNWINSIYDNGVIQKEVKEITITHNENEIVYHVGRTDEMPVSQVSVFCEDVTTGAVSQTERLTFSGIYRETLMIPFSIGVVGNGLVNGPFKYSTYFDFDESKYYAVDSASSGYEVKSGEVISNLSLFDIKFTILIYRLRDKGKKNVYPIQEVYIQNWYEYKLKSSTLATVNYQTYTFENETKLENLQDQNTVNINCNIDDFLLINFGSVEIIENTVGSFVDTYLKIENSGVLKFTCENPDDTTQRVAVTVNVDCNVQEEKIWLEVGGKRVAGLNEISGTINVKLSTINQFIDFKNGVFEFVIRNTNDDISKLTNFYCNGEELEFNQPIRINLDENLNEKIAISRMVFVEQMYTIKIINDNNIDDFLSFDLGSGENVASLDWFYASADEVLDADDMMFFGTKNVDDVYFVDFFDDNEYDFIISLLIPQKYAEIDTERQGLWLRNLTTHRGNLVSVVGEAYVGPDVFEVNYEISDAIFIEHGQIVITYFDTALDREVTIMFGIQII